MQTAEEFARIILANCMVDLSYVPPLVKLLERDRNATRLAAKLELLHEIREEAKFHSGPTPCTADEIALAFDLAWDKYTQPVQLTKGEK